MTFSLLVFNFHYFLSEIKKKGGGPVGLTAALFLKKFGINFALIEKSLQLASNANKKTFIFFSTSKCSLFKYENIGGFIRNKRIR